MNLVISIFTIFFICLLIKIIFSKINTKIPFSVNQTNETEKNISPKRKNKINKFKLGDKVLVWDFDEDENIVGNLPVDNLYIENLWYMKDTVGEGQLCTGVNIIDDQNFSFSTFECFCYFMHIENDEVTLIERVFTK